MVLNFKNLVKTVIVKNTETRQWCFQQAELNLVVLCIEHAIVILNLVANSLSH